MKEFSARTRVENIECLQEEFFDLVIIGGGITGAGTARDAAMRGMRVALVEAKDFASGTSSRSSKLIHGGIRYLENLEFKLVFEALSERTKLFSMAPNLVHPLRFMLPLYEGGRVGMTKMGLGMWLYDALSLFQAPEMHERLNKTETTGRMPSLQNEKLMGSYVYSDAYMDDDRLVHETLRSANEAGAVCANYVKAMGAQFDEQRKMTRLECQDQLSGKKFSIRGRHFVSSVGPWTDEVASDLLAGWKKILRPTKGVHLTFTRERLPLSSAVVMAAEKRIVFAIPRHEMVIVGTTDTDFSGSPSDVVTKNEDVEYLLTVIDRYFPHANIERKDIVASYAGVRPLVNDGAENEGKTSREHTIFTDEHDITFVAGGKYTTYRLMAKQVVDEVLKHWTIEDRAKYRPAATYLPLNPLVTLDTQNASHAYMAQLDEMTTLLPNEIALLVERHGGEAIEIVRRYGLQTGYWALEAHHAIETTMCLNIVDFYTRRVPLFLARKDHGQSVFPEIAAVFAEKFGWDSSEIQRQKELLVKYQQHELGWQ